VSKGEETRTIIIEKAAPIFNKRGYSGTSLSDIMEATGLQKGGIYNHFANKDAIALEAFDYAYGIARERYRTALREAGRDPVKQLFGMLEVFARNVEDPPIAGGCPVLNTAIDSDDTHPELRLHARNAITEWRMTIQKIIGRGQDRGVFREEVHGDTVATTIIALLEGAVMMSRLYRDRVFMDRAVAHVRQYLEKEVLLPPA
jgi:TetR/AcrR family transcriptional repressor of nem operon